MAIREYFYFQSSFGFLYLSSTPHKNLFTRFTHLPFLNQFYNSLRPCSHPSYDYVSKCGREMNYLAYERNILVYHSLVGNHLYYGGDLKTVFDPKKLLKDQDCLYYPLDTDLEKRLGVSVGLLSSRISVGLMEKIDMDLVQDLVAK